MNKLHYDSLKTKNLENSIDLKGKTFNFFCLHPKVISCEVF